MLLNFQKGKHIIQVPASTTNLGPGFDALGLALKLFLRVEVEAAGPENEIVLEGDEVDGLPDSENNLIWRVMNEVFTGEGRETPKARMRICNQIPLARGLGSSAAAIVAGIGCYEALSSVELAQERFFHYAMTHEKEPDNITAARYGGFTITCTEEADEQVIFFRSEISTSLKILLTIPDFHLPTETSRAVLPQELSMQAAVYNIQRSSLLVAAMLQQKVSLLAEAVKDQMHQSFRAKLIPGLTEILDLPPAQIPGLIGSCLSGAGPCVLTFLESNAAQIKQRLHDIFIRHGVESRGLILEIDNQGRTISSPATS